MNSSKQDLLAGDWPDPSMFKQSIRIQFAVYVCGMIVLLMTVTGYVTSNLYVKTVTRNVAEKILVQARSYSVPAGKMIISGDEPDVQVTEDDWLSIIYTSGTTGHPKGALYSHRSTVLHSWAACMIDTLAISSRSVILPIVPMFHANAWGLPYAAPLCGAKLVMPGAQLDGESVHELIEAEQADLIAGVPTVSA